MLRKQEEVEVKVKARDARIEERLRSGVSLNKGVKHLAATTQAASYVLLTVTTDAFSMSFHTMSSEFQASLKSYDDLPGFSNQTVKCVGDTATRSFLASICDSDRFMGTLSFLGITLVNKAKKTLEQHEIYHGFRGR